VLIGLLFMESESKVGGDKMKLFVYDEKIEISHHLSDSICEASIRSIEDHGHFYIAFSGGSLPKVLKIV